MATKRCINGHQYDSSIYGDNCPFCPAKTEMNGAGFGGDGYKTVAMNNIVEDLKTRPMIGMEDKPTKPLTDTAPRESKPSFSVKNNPSRTRIRVIGEQPEKEIVSGRRLVGMLVSFSTNPNGEVYKIFEGRNIIGRSEDCDITIANDDNVSDKHLLILFREDDGFTAADQYSTNGTFINGKFLKGDCTLSSEDIIVTGATKFMFFAVPNF